MNILKFKITDMSFFFRNKEGNPVFPGRLVSLKRKTEAPSVQ